MGVLDELKKVLFGAKSVTKSKANSVSEDFSERAREMREEVKQKSDRISHDTKEYIDKKVDDVMETSDDAVERIKDATEEIGSKVLDASADLLEKASEVGSSLADRVSKTVDAGKNFVDEHKDDVQDRLKDLKDKATSKFDETFDRAQKEAAHEETQKDVPYESSAKAKETLQNSSLPDDSDDFWDKAEAYADGRYEDVRDTGSIKVMDNISAEEKPPLPSSSAPGFTDLDNDGSEIVDDALTEDDLPSEG